MNVLFFNIRGNHILKVLEELNSPVGILQFVNKKRGTASITYQFTRHQVFLPEGYQGHSLIIALTAIQQILIIMTKN